jgi:hypothetical protein
MSKQIECDVCEKSFDKPCLLKRHKKKKIPCVKSKTCIYCNIPFTRVSNLRKHLKYVCKKENSEYYKNNNITNNDNKQVNNNNITNNKQVNNNNITNNNNEQVNNNMAINILTEEYIIQNFSEEHCLMTLPDYNIIKDINIYNEVFLN